MGRWVWMHMEGKANLHVRLVTAYRPCESSGASTVFQQHSRALAKKGDFRNPRTAILEDLAEAIIEWKTLGDHVILAMDANEDVRFGEVNDTFSKAGLREIILDLHRDKSPPATYNRNTQRQPIDGMWATCGITPTSVGYFAFGDGCPSDHRRLYFETTYSVAFGQHPPGSMSPLHPKQLKAKDPWLTKKYRKQVKAKIATSRFKSRFDDFKLEAKIEWNQQLQRQYNKLQ